jgi:hypothetical protein
MAIVSSSQPSFQRRASDLQHRADVLDVGHIVTSNGTSFFEQRRPSPGTFLDQDPQQGSIALDSYRFITGRLGLQAVFQISAATAGTIFKEPPMADGRHLPLIVNDDQATLPVIILAQSTIPFLDLFGQSRGCERRNLEI